LCGRETLGKRSASANVLARCGVRPILHRPNKSRH